MAITKTEPSFLLLSGCRSCCRMVSRLLPTHPGMNSVVRNLLDQPTELCYEPRSKGKVGSLLPTRRALPSRFPSVFPGASGMMVLIAAVCEKQIQAVGPRAGRSQDHSLRGRDFAWLQVSTVAPNFLCHCPLRIVWLSPTSAAAWGGFPEETTKFYNMPSYRESTKHDAVSSLSS